jgi:hypothetical protein
MLIQVVTLAIETLRRAAVVFFMEARFLISFSHRKTSSAAIIEKAMYIQMSEMEWVSSVLEGQSTILESQGI